MTEKNEDNLVIMSEKVDWWLLLQRVLILSWDRWPKCLIAKIIPASHYNATKASFCRTFAYYRTLSNIAFSAYDQINCDFMELGFYQIISVRFNNK